MPDESMILTQRLAACALILTGFLCDVGIAQERVIDREPKIKAVYVYKFIRYIAWPDDAFADATSPVVIGTVGQDPVNAYLKLIASSRKAGERSMHYREITSANQAAGCHLIFVSADAAPDLVSGVLQGLPTVPVVLIGETPHFVAEGGVIGFYVVNNKIRLKMSLDAAASRGLKVSSQLAKLADIVDQKELPRKTTHDFSDEKRLGAAR